MQGPVTRMVFQALTRPETVAGAEKMPLGVVVTAGIMFGFMAWLFWSIGALIVALGCFFVGVPLLHRLAKEDPRMIAVYVANFRFKPYYPARTGAHVRLAKTEGRTAGHAFTLAAVILSGIAWFYASTLLWILAGGAFIGAIAWEPIANRRKQAAQPATSIEQEA